MARAHREIDDGVLASCQLAVAAGDRLVAYETIGDAAPDSRYVIFSCTKALVVGAFWLLLAEGAVTLDQTVAEIIPEFATNGKEVVTVRQLVLHESGFPHAPLDLLADTTRASAPGPLRGLAAELGAGHPVRVPPDLGPLGHGRADRATQRRRLPRRSSASACWCRSGCADSSWACPSTSRATSTTWRSAGEPPTSAELEAVFGVPGLTLEGLQGEVTDAALMGFNRPEVRALGVPGGGGVSTAADLAMYYQALLHNPGGLWDPAVLAAGTGEVHGRLPDPLTQRVVQPGAGAGHRRRRTPTWPCGASATRCRHAPSATPVPAGSSRSPIPSRICRSAT